MYLREAAGAGGQLHGSQDAARESEEAWVSAPAGGEAPSEVLSIPLLLDSSQATLGLWVSGSPG